MTASAATQRGRREQRRGAYRGSVHAGREGYGCCCCGAAACARAVAHGGCGCAHAWTRAAVLEDRVRLGEPGRLRAGHAHEACA